MGASIDKLLFQAPSPSYSETDERFMHLLTRRGKNISSFFINNSEVYTILFSHGNAEDLGLIYGWFKQVGRILRVNVFSYDYTGYGHNKSKPSEEDCYADIDAAMDYLTNIAGIPPSKVILWGRSLGTGPSCYLASKQSGLGDPVCGLILQSPLMSAFRVALHFRWTLMGDQFANIDILPDVRCPVFIIHGTQDEVVPFWHGQELYLAVHKEHRYPPYWVQDGGHNNVEMIDPQKFFAQVTQFLDVVTKNPKAKISS